MFGKKITDSHRLKLSNAHKGKQGYWKNKTHSDATKKKISVSISGKNNPFYGKKHTLETKHSISKSKKGKCSGENNSFFGKRHTKETILRITEKCDKWRQENPELSYEYSLNGWRNSIFSKIKYGIKTSIERKVEEKLVEFDITKFNFSQILDRKYQYDFRIGNNILLEVHGDYWHGNPKKYGPTKKPLNKQQRNKIKQDIIKKIYAETNGWILFVIWEDDIKNNN
jgi:G:T-mismatch repair DNA endonuclease (very short patch repair protein)